MTHLIRLLRPRQWIKNSFVMAPLVFTGKFSESLTLLHALLAMLLFCVASSAAYIINDWCDIERDRAHPTKVKTRPLASGDVTRRGAAILLAFLLLILGVSALWLPKVLLVIGIYIVFNLAYTLWLKHQPVVDIFCIAISFVLRVYAGAVAIDVTVSSWMFITTLCLALYLASIKRRQELLIQGQQGREVLGQYTVRLVERYAEMSAMGALLFYSLFVMTAKPELVITIPLVLYGLYRYWYLVEVHSNGESPTDTLLMDAHLLLTSVLWCVLCVWLLWFRVGVSV